MGKSGGRIQTHARGHCLKFPWDSWNQWPRVLSGHHSLPFLAASSSSQYLSFLSQHGTLQGPLLLSCMFSPELQSCINTVRWGQVRRGPWGSYQTVKNNWWRKIRVYKEWPDHLVGSRGDVYVAEMTITDLTYTDTGTFTCTYNGTTDISSIDNSTKVTILLSVI